MLWTLCLIVIAASTVCASSASSSKVITVTANQSRVRQRFNGFGWSAVSGSIVAEDYLEQVSEDVLYALCEGLDTRVVRFWYRESDFNPDHNQAAINDFVNKYYTNGLMKRLRAHGVQQFLLAPDGPTHGNTSLQASHIVEIIRLLRQNNTFIDVTGVGNEPGYTNAELVEMVNAVYKGLDSLGLAKEVKIVAPESANQDRAGLEYIQACQNDTACWQRLFGIAGHSYNMAATDDWDATILTADGQGPPHKAYWMTEAGDGGGDFTTAGASLAGRFLNDLNHLVDTWVWFIGVEHHSPRPGQDTMRLIITWPNGSSGNSTHGQTLYTFNPAYYYAHQITHTFEPGCELRYCASNDPSIKDMTWTYGLKPDINVAVGRNDDGSWGIAVSNPTGSTNTSISWFTGPSTYTVEVLVPELANAGSVVFHAQLSVGDSTLNEPQGSVIMTDGKLSVKSIPLSLWSFRSEPVA